MNQGDVLAKLRTRRLARPSAIALVLSNLVPLFGVLALGWDVFPVMALYWMEDIVVGFYNVLRMACCADRRYGGVGFKVFTPQATESGGFQILLSVRALRLPGAEPWHLQYYPGPA